MGDSDPPCLLLYLRSLFHGCLLNWIEVLGYCFGHLLFTTLSHVFISLLHLKVLESWAFVFLQVLLLCSVRNCGPARNWCSPNTSETAISFVEYFVLYKDLPHWWAWVSQWALKRVLTGQKRKPARWFQDQQRAPLVELHHWWNWGTPLGGYSSPSSRFPYRTVLPV